MAIVEVKSRLFCLDKHKLYKIPESQHLHYTHHNKYTHSTLTNTIVCSVHYTNTSHTPGYQLGQLRVQCVHWCGGLVQHKKSQGNTLFIYIKVPGKYPFYMQEIAHQLDMYMSQCVPKTFTAHTHTHTYLFLLLVKHVTCCRKNGSDHQLDPGTWPCHSLVSNIYQALPEATQAVLVGIIQHVRINKFKKNPIIYASNLPLGGHDNISSSNRTLSRYLYHTLISYNQENCICHQCQDLGSQQHRVYTHDMITVRMGLK